MILSNKMEFIKKISSIFNPSQGSKFKRVYILGFAQSGKTTFAHCLIYGEPPKLTRATQGIDVSRKSVRVGNIDIQTFDIGGQKIFQKFLWGAGAQDAQAIVYLIDGSIDENDPKFKASKEAFDLIPSLGINSNTPIVIVINKQDLPDALSEEKYRKIYEADKILFNLNNKVFLSSAINNLGVIEPIEWLSSQLKS